MTGKIQLASEPQLDTVRTLVMQSVNKLRGRLTHDVAQGWIGNATAIDRLVEQLCSPEAPPPIHYRCNSTMKEAFECARLRPGRILTVVYTVPREMSWREVHSKVSASPIELADVLVTIENGKLDKGGVTHVFSFESLTVKVSWEENAYDLYVLGHNFPNNPKKGYLVYG